MKKSLPILILIISIVSTVYGQQWSGNDNTTSAISRTGNVGIGTSSVVTDKLEVESSSTGNVQFRIRNTNTIHGSGASILLYANAFGNRSSKLSNIPDFNGSNFVFNIRKADNSYFDAMTIRGNGQIGIGTITPTARLSFHSDNSSLTDILDIKAGTASRQWALSYDQDSWLQSKLSFDEFESNGTRHPRLTIKAGNVGIGTISPDAKLTVKGDIHTREVRVDMNGAVGPDYVFEENYDLRTLEETERYIRTNKHLPEIQSAQEMNENGFELKEMNLKLLQKVEELTLYLIEQNKKVETLQKEMKELKSEK